MAKKDNDDLRLDGGQLGTSPDDETSGLEGLHDETSRLDDLLDSAPDWLKPEGVDPTIDALIEEARDSVAEMPPAEVNAAREALAAWSSGYRDPAKELADLERLRAQMKTLPKDKLKPGQFAAVKERIAALKAELGLS